MSYVHKTTNAFDLVAAIGDNLIGRQIVTEAVGEYPGGVATIIELFPDLEAAPEIVMQVHNPEYKSDDGLVPPGQMGIFEWEDVILLEPKHCGEPALVVVCPDAEPSAETSSHSSQ